MTTIPTPYDAEENAFQEWLSEHGGESAPRTPVSEWHRAWRLGGAEGYRRAKAEDAAPLEAAKMVDEAGQDCQRLRIYNLRIREQVKFLTSELLENDGTFVTVRARELDRLERILLEEPDA